MSGKQRNPERTGDSRRSLQRPTPSTDLVSQIGYSGPIPPATELRYYDEIVPGTAAKIIDTFLAQSEHRRNLERQVVEANIRQAWVGLWLNFVQSVTVIILFAVLAIVLRNPLLALGSVGGLATTVGSFIAALHGQRQERLDKLRVLAGANDDE